MSQISLPQPKALERLDGVEWDAPSNAVSRWASMPMAAEANDPNTISIYGTIGADPWGYGEEFSAQRMAAALRRIGPNAVTVNIHSPGGDLFEGLAIYNLLAEHPAKVKIRNMGLMASAASVVAMAGDEIEVGLGTFIMVHNAWGVVIGSKADMRATADHFEAFDAGMVEIYAARTGKDKKKVADWMAAETWFSAAEAVEAGLATSVFERAEPSAPAKASVDARFRLDAILSKQGMPRSERRRLLREALGTRSAADTDKPRAVLDPALVAATISTLRTSR